MLLSAATSASDEGPSRSQPACFTPATDFLEESDSI